MDAGTKARIASAAIENPILRAAAKDAFFKQLSTNDPEQGDNDGSKNDDEDGDDDNTKAIKAWASRLGIAYLVIFTLCIICAWYNILTTAAESAATGFIAIYVFFFSILICCFECSSFPFFLKIIAVQIAVNFGFLYNPVGRGIFLIFVAVLLYQLSIFGKVMFAFVLVLIVVEIYVSVRYPKYGDYIRKLHYAKVHGQPQPQPQNMTAQPKKGMFGF